MPPRSLYEQAKTATIRNINLLTDIGHLPYSFMRPILIRLENPHQLRTLERTCPQLVGDDGEVWLKFIKRDVPNWEKKNYEPSKRETWEGVYDRLIKEAEEDSKRADEDLRQKMATIQAQRTANTITAPTKMMPEKGAKRKVGPTTFSRMADKSMLRFTSGSKTKNVMERARREAAEAKFRRQGALTTPSHLLASGRVRQAPRTMIEARQQQAARPTGFKLSKSATQKPALPPKLQQSSSSSLADREAKLKALQSGNGSSYTSLAPDANYKVPHLGQSVSPLPQMRSSMAQPGSPAVLKRKRAPDVFMKVKKR